MPRKIKTDWKWQFQFLLWERYHEQTYLKILNAHCVCSVPRTDTVNLIISLFIEMCIISGLAESK